MMFRTLLAVVSVWITIIHAAPPQLGLKFDKRAGALPTLTLPYATYRAARYNPNGDVRLVSIAPADTCTKFILDLCFQKYPFRRSTYWKPPLG